jgi:hypothetical protein
MQQPQQQCPVFRYSPHPSVAKTVVWLAVTAVVFAVGGFLAVAGLLGVAPFAAIGRVPSATAAGFQPYRPRVGSQALPEGPVPANYALFFRDDGNALLPPPAPGAGDDEASDQPAPAPATGSPVIIALRTFEFSVSEVLAGGVVGALAPRPSDGAWVLDPAFAGAVAFDTIFEMQAIGRTAPEWEAGPWLDSTVVAVNVRSGGAAGALVFAPFSTVRHFSAAAALVVHARMTLNVAALPATATAGDEVVFDAAFELAPGLATSPPSSLPPPEFLRSEFAVRFVVVVPPP